MRQNYTSTISPRTRERGAAALTSSSGVMGYKVIDFSQSNLGSSALTQEVIRAIYLSHDMHALVTTPTLSSWTLKLLWTLLLVLLSM